MTADLDPSPQSQQSFAPPWRMAAGTLLCLAGSCLRFARSFTKLQEKSVENRFSLFSAMAEPEKFTAPWERGRIPLCQVREGSVGA
jgi:hypothetical protein